MGDAGNPSQPIYNWLMLRPLSVNEIQRVCRDQGLAISSSLIKRTHQVFNSAVEIYYEKKSDRAKNPDSHYALDVAIQRFAGCPEGSRNISHPEALHPFEVRDAMAVLFDAKLALKRIGFREAILDLLFDYLVDELTPLSQGTAGMKEETKKRQLFEELADLYVNEIQSGAKLTERSAGMKFIHGLLSEAGLSIGLRRLRSWAEKRSRTAEKDRGLV